MLASVGEGTVTAVITTLGVGTLLVTRMKISSSNVTESRLEWLDQIKTDFITLNDIILEMMNIIEDDGNSRHEKVEIDHDKYKKQLNKLDKIDHKISQNLKPIKYGHFKHKQANRLPGKSYRIEAIDVSKNLDFRIYKDIRDSNNDENEQDQELEIVIQNAREIEDYWRVHIDNLKLTLGQYNSSPGIIRFNEIYPATKTVDDRNVNQIEDFSVIYNVIKVKKDMLNEIQTTLTKIEWEKIKEESYFNRKKNKSINNVFISPLNNYLEAKEQLILDEVMDDHLTKEKEKSIKNYEKLKVENEKLKKEHESLLKKYEEPNKENTGDKINFNKLKEFMKLREENNNSNIDDPENNTLDQNVNTAKDILKKENEILKKENMLLMNKNGKTSNEDENNNIENEPDIIKSLNQNKTAYIILSEAIEEVLNNDVELPKSMLTPSGQRYIYTHPLNDTHPNGRKFFNPKLYSNPNKDNSAIYKIETNFSKVYAYKYAEIIKDYE